MPAAAKLLQLARDAVEPALRQGAVADDRDPPDRPRRQGRAGRVEPDHMGHGRAQGGVGFGIRRRARQGQAEGAVRQGRGDALEGPVEPRVADEEPPPRRQRVEGRLRRADGFETVGEAKRGGDGGVGGGDERRVARHRLGDMAIAAQVFRHPCQRAGMGRFDRQDAVVQPAGHGPRPRVVAGKAGRAVREGAAQRAALRRARREAAGGAGFVEQVDPGTAGPFQREEGRARRLGERCGSLRTDAAAEAQPVVAVRRLSRRQPEGEPVPVGSGGWQGTAEGGRSVEDRIEDEVRVEGQHGFETGRAEMREACRAVRRRQVAAHDRIGVDVEYLVEQREEEGRQVGLPQQLAFGGIDLLVGLRADVIELPPRIGMAGIEADGRGIGAGRLAPPALQLQHMPELEMGVGAGGLPIERLAIGDLGAAQEPLLLEGVAELHAERPAGGVDGERRRVMGGRRCPVGGPRGAIRVAEVSSEAAQPCGAETQQCGKGGGHRAVAIRRRIARPIDRANRTTLPQGVRRSSPSTSRRSAEARAHAGHVD